MKAPFAYYGGKSGMADRLVALMPDHRVYIEPFFGSGAVLFAKEPANCEIVNDLDDLVVNFFRILRERPEDLAEVCRLTPHARAEYLAARDDPAPADDLERARLFWVRVNQSFGKTASAKTGWSVTTARSQSVPGSILGRIERFGPCAQRLMRVSIESCNAADLIRRLATSDALAYVDPPYLAETRVMRTSEASDYRHDMGDPAPHEDLAEALNATPAKVILSGYPSPLYDALYADWNVVDFEVTSFSSNARTKVRTGRIERIWLNYDPPAENVLDFGGLA
jgi:DNA adenine methylase